MAAVSEVFLVPDLDFFNKFNFLFMSVCGCPMVVIMVVVVVVFVVVAAAVFVVVFDDAFSKELAVVLGDVVVKLAVTVSVVIIIVWVVEDVDNVARLVVVGEVVVDCDKLTFDMAGCLMSTESVCVLLDAASIIPLFINLGGA